MRPRTLLVLSILVLGLGAFIWFYERDLPTSDERRESADRVLDLEADAVSAVVIARGGETVAMKRPTPDNETTDSDGEGGDGDDSGTEDEPQSEPRWRLVEPIDYRADESQIDSLLATLENLEAERWLEEFQPAELGLESPRATVRLTVDGEEIVLAVGSEIPGYETMAVRRKGDPRVAVVPKRLWTDLDQPIEAWRDHSLLPADRDEIRALRWGRGGAAIAIEKRGDEFRVLEPIEDVADSSQVQTLLTQLTTVQVEEFLPAEAELEAEESEVVRLEVGIEGRAEPFRISLGPAPQTDEAAEATVEETAVETPEDAATRLAVLGGDTIVSLAADSLAALDVPPQEWRSPAATELAGYQVDRLELERVAGGEITLARVEGRFERDGEEIAYDVAMDLIDAVTGLQAEKIVVPDAIEIEDSPIVTIGLTGEDGEVARLQIFSSREQGVPLRTEGREAILLLPRAQLDELQRTADAVLEAEVVEAETSDEPATGGGPR